LDHVVKICQGTFDKCLEIKIEVPVEKAMVQGDPTHLEQVLLNLCVNANHAMTIMKPADELHGGRLTISMEKIHAVDHFCSIHHEAEEIDYWKLSVIDTGVGMDSSTISKIFVPFFMTKEKGKGTGLGLSMVYTIVHQHNGFIDRSPV
jgi:signal transduction histidine kinase